MRQSSGWAFSANDKKKKKASLIVGDRQIYKIKIPQLLMQATEQCSNRHRNLMPPDKSVTDLNDTRDVNDRNRRIWFMPFYGVGFWSVCHGYKGTERLCTQPLQSSFE